VNELEMDALVVGLVEGLASHALELGRFDKVNQHEPKSPPGQGLTAAIWTNYIGPVPAASSLNTTTGLVIMNVRAYMPLSSEPEDLIDPAMLSAVAQLMGAYSGGFSLGILDADGDPAAWIDLLGQTRSRLDASAGYISQDERQFRVMTIVVPVIVPDLWVQAQ
jgi:hypothetical protein